MSKSNYDLILVIVNQGFSESVMDAAREAGARGGTVISGRGTAKEETLAKFKIFMTPEKEIVLILADEAIKEQILVSINTHCGLSTDAHGIVFTLPCDEVVGLKAKAITSKELDEVKEDTKDSNKENK